MQYLLNRRCIVPCFHRPGFSSQGELAWSSYLYRRRSSSTLPGFAPTPSFSSSFLTTVIYPTTFKRTHLSSLINSLIDFVFRLLRRSFALIETTHRVPEILDYIGIRHYLSNFFLTGFRIEELSLPVLTFSQILLARLFSPLPPSPSLTPKVHSIRVFMGLIAKWQYRSFSIYGSFFLSTAIQ